MAEQAITVPDSPAVEAEVPKKQVGPVFRAAGGPVKWADERIGVAGLLRPFFRKVFPDHWSFLLGEIALYSFIVLLLSGVFLTIWFKPSMAEIEYEGTYELLRGLPMSEAYASTLSLSFDIRGGLLLRQMHHWAAALFVAAMLAHSLRIFFTGAFRKPRELNWVIGVVLLALGIFEGFFGYSLPDDLLSGTGLRFLDGAVRATPVIGTWAVSATPVRVSTTTSAAVGDEESDAPVTTRRLEPICGVWLPACRFPRSAYAVGRPVDRPP